MKYEIHHPPVAVILAAGLGSSLSPLTDDCPKCLLSVGGSIILERIIRNCLSCGISQFVMVLGHQSDTIVKFVTKAFRGIRVTYAINDLYQETDTGYSLMMAAPAIRGSAFIKFDADMVFDTKILRSIVESSLPNVLSFDRNAPLGTEEIKVKINKEMRVLEVGKSVQRKVAMGKSIGIEKISSELATLLFAELSKRMKEPTLRQEHYEVTYSKIADNSSNFHALDITGHKWIKIDTIEDLKTANTMFASPVATISRTQQKDIDEKNEHEGE